MMIVLIRCPAEELLVKQHPRSRAESIATITGYRLSWSTERTRALAEGSGR